MLFSICGKKAPKQNNIGGAILIGVEVGDGWFVRLTRFARVDGLQIAGDYVHVRFTLYTVDDSKCTWRPQKPALFT